MNIKLIGTITVAAVVTTISTVTAVVNTIKTNRTMKKLNEAFDKVEEMSKDKITEAMIEKAVNKAADDKVESHLKRVQLEVINRADRDLVTAAHNAVENCARDIRKQASGKVSEQVANLDIEALKRTVCDQAEKHVLEKLDGCLDASVKKFKDQLDYTKRIHEKYAIACEEDDDDNEERVRLVLLK